MERTLTFGKQQVYTSSRMRKHPIMAKMFRAIFGYTNLGNYARFTVFQNLLKKVQIPNDAKILDLGAGYGEYSFSLAEAYSKAQVHAMDINKERVATIKEAIVSSAADNVIAHHSYLEQLSEAEFDFIYSVDVFEHILPAEMPFKAAHRRLKAEGQLLVKMPNVIQKTILPENWFEEHQDWLDDEHIGQVYDLQDLKKRFEFEGFEVVEACYTDGWWSRLGWELAYLGKKAGVITQLISLPIAKFMVKIDRIVHSGKTGNSIQVIGKKI